MANKPIYQFHAELEEYKPTMWRRFKGDHPMKIVTTIGIDLAKNSFSVYGVDAKDKPVLSRTARRCTAVPPPRVGGTAVQWRK